MENSTAEIPENRASRSDSWMWQVLVLLIIAVGLWVRLVDLTDQPLDFHPTRQLRSAIIARGIYYQSLSNVDVDVRNQAMLFWSSMEVYEPTIFEWLVAMTYRLIGSEQLWVARLYSCVAWLIGGLALYALLRRIFSPAAGVFSLGFYLLLPWGVVASRVFQPDPPMVMWILLSAYALFRWGETHGMSWLWTVLAGLSCGIAILVKIYALFFVAPMLLGILADQLLEGGKLFHNLRRMLTMPQVWAVAVLAVIIPGAYYLGLGQRSSDFASFWIVSFSKLLLEPKFYVKWLALIHGLMDVTVFLTALLGVFLIPGRGRVIGLGLWAGYLGFGITFPFQIYTHDYYSLVAVPMVALSLAPLADLAFKRLEEVAGLWKVLFLVILLAITSYYTWVSRSQFFAMSYRLEPVPWQQMGAELPKNGDIIALTHDYGNRLKYYGWRMVNSLWPGEDDIALSAAAGMERIDNFERYFQTQTEGMEYFLVTLFSDLDAQPNLKSELYDHYPIYAQGDGYILFDLRQRH